MTHTTHTTPSGRASAAILDTAAALIDDRGWRGPPGEPAAPGSLCASTALDAARLATGARPVEWVDAWEALERVIATDLGLPQIVAWNDTPGRTAGQVTAALRRAAEAERQAAA